MSGRCFDCACLLTNTNVSIMNYSLLLTTVCLKSQEPQQRKQKTFCGFWSMLTSYCIGSRYLQNILPLVPDFLDTLYNMVTKAVVFDVVWLYGLL